MYIRDISLHEFTEYAKSHDLCSYAQTLNYAMLMSEYDYDYELICLTDKGEIKAVALLLLNDINGVKYAYSPKGFLIDYKDENLLKIFTKELKKYCIKENISFVKINPEIITATIDNNSFEKSYNTNVHIIESLQKLGYTKLKDNLYFESMFPRFTGILDLRNLDVKSFSKNTKNKIKKGIRKGLEYSTENVDNIKYLNKFRNNSSFYYKDLFNIYNKTGEVNLINISINNIKFLDNSQKYYIQEYDKNQNLNETMAARPHSKNINKKMQSDKLLLTYKKDIMESTKLVEDNINHVIASALVVKNNRKVTILSAAYDKEYKRFVPNYFLYYSVIKHFSKTHDFIDLNGLSGDFTSESPYYGLNSFKLGFNPKIIEYIGEFDLIVNEKEYYYLLKHKLLTKEFQKKHN